MRISLQRQSKAPPKRILTVFAAIVGIGLGSASAWAQTQRYDHLRCARIKDSAQIEGRLGLEPVDPVSTGIDDGCKTRRGAWFCEPARADYGSIGSETIDLQGAQLTDVRVCYRTRCPLGTPAMFEVTDPLGFRMVEKKARTSLMCTPALEGPPPGASCLTFVAAIGGPEPGSANGKFVLPEGVDVDADGRLYVADTGNNRIQVFDQHGIFLRKWGEQGTGDGQFVSPHDLAVALDTGGYTNVYVVDTDSDRVQQFALPNVDGDCPQPGQLRIDGVCFVRTWGQYGTEMGSFINPVGIAVGNAGRVYVAETGNNRVQRFDADGNWELMWGNAGNGDGEFRGPHGVAVGPDGSVYVADAANHRVQVFDPDGEYIRQWGSLGDGDQEFRTPQDVAVNDVGIVYVSELAGNRVKAFAPDGQMLARTDERPDVDLSSPHGLAAFGDRVYSTDEDNHRIQELLCMQ